MKTKIQTIWDGPPQFCGFCLPTFVVAEVVLKPCVNFCKDLQHIKGLEFQFKILGVVREDERYQTVEECTNN